MDIEPSETFIKTLSANDVGATGGHQAGILIPRIRRVIDYFPSLDVVAVNPRTPVKFFDALDGKELTFTFVYYNGALTGLSTRNEYRLTGMTEFLRRRKAIAGDGLELSTDVHGKRYISHLPLIDEAQTNLTVGDPDVLVLSHTWKIRKARSS